MIHEDHRCKLIEDFVTNFNEYRTHIFSPSDLIYAVESISQWYRHGGHWIDLGFPVCVAIYRKPDNGSEIQNATCRRSGIIICLRIFKSARNEEEQKDDEENLIHSIKVQKELVLPWDNMDRIVCADS